MKQKYLILLTLCTYFFGILSVYAYEVEVDCSSIKDDDARLKCFDETINRELKPLSIFSKENEEMRYAKNKFTIIPHNPNYFMPITYAEKLNEKPHDDLLIQDGQKEEFQHLEAKFQISYKMPVTIKRSTDRTSYWFGYTQTSFWQVYNSKISKPFRENNYEPELFCMHEPESDTRLFGMRNAMNSIHFSHQSNGRASTQSRSWNRIVAKFIFEKDQNVLVIKPWFRLPESREDDENPAMHKFVGYGELHYFMKINEEICSLRLYSNLRTDESRNSIELSWSVPLGSNYKGFIQYFDGYAENLMDFDFRSRRLGIGILLTDWM